MRKTIFISLCLLVCYTLLTKAIGIVIADEKRQTILFNSSSSNIISFVDTIASQYDKVIIHLGRGSVFQSGNIYSSKTSRENLQLFCKLLDEKKISLYLWFFDSFGSESFLELYKNHTTMLDENMDEIEKLGLKYKGIVVDIEWINLENENNNKKFITLLENIRKRIGYNCDLQYFATLTNDEEENEARGYSTSKCKKYAIPIVMLYATSSGFSASWGSIQPRMDDKRIKTLSDYFSKKNWDVVVSLHQPWLIISKKRTIEFEIPFPNSTFSSNYLNFRKKKETKYYTFEYYKLTQNVNVNSTNKKELTLKRGEKIVKGKLRKESIQPNYYLWEYYNILDSNK